MVEIFSCLSYDDAGESQKGNQVWNSHETIDDIRQDPDGFKLQECAACDEDDEDDAIGKDALRAAEIDHAAFPIVVPSEDGGESEEDQPDHQHIAAEYGECIFESGIRECCTVETIHPFAGNDDGKTGQCADDDGIDEGTGHRDQTLFCRPFGLSGSSYDRSRAEAGFIGEYASGDTISHREHHCRAQETAGCCTSGEGTVHDGLNGCRHLVCEIHRS